MDRLIQIRNAAGDPVQSGVTVDSAHWQDSAAGTPSATVAVVSAANGVWRVTVADPTIARGSAGVLLAYDDGTGTTVKLLVVVDSGVGLQTLLDLDAAFFRPRNAAAGSAVEYENADGSVRFSATPAAANGAFGGATRP